MNRRLSLSPKGNNNNGIIFHHRNNARQTKIHNVNNKSMPVNKRSNISQRQNVTPRNNVVSKKPISIKSNRPGSKSIDVVSRPIREKTTAVRAARFTQSKRTSKKLITDKNKINSIKDIGVGKFLIILAPGPSLLEVDISKFLKVDNLDTMTINKPDKRCWKTDYWMFCDRSQYYRNKEKFDTYNRYIINSNSIDLKKENQVRINTISGKGFSHDMLKGFYIGRSTTYSSMQVAMWMGYDKIFIFGCDMRRVEVEINGKKKSLLHSYGVNPDVPESTREKRFKEEAKFYDNASKILSKEQRNKFYFCSSYNKWPFVDKYNRLDHKSAVDVILEMLKEHKNG